MSNAPPSQKLYQQIARDLAGKIVSGTYPQGARLPGERDLAELHKVSRPTIREAMIALEMQGLVESRHGSGIYVMAPPSLSNDAEDLDVGPFELTEARRLVEGEACALAALSINDAEVAELRALLAAMAEELGPEGQVLKGPHDQADRRFHVVIAGATRNSALVGVIETLWDLRYRSPLCREMLARARRAGDRPRIGEHTAIVEALAARDPGAARRAMREHLDHVIEGLLETTESDAVKQARSDAAERRSAYARRAAI